jgi:hypothetical protein
VIKSEAHLDEPRDLVRLAHRLPFTGWLGGLNGAGFVRGVAQNGVSLVVAERLIGIIGRDLAIVGPWEPLLPPPAPAPPLPLAAVAAPPQEPSAPARVAPSASPSRKR